MNSREPASRERGRHRREPSRLVTIGAPLALVVAGAAVVGAVWAGSVDRVRTVSAGGVTFTTNVDVREQSGSIYVLLPVNTDVSGVVLEPVHGGADVEAAIEQIDTFVPGEHELVFDEFTIRVIVDGIER